MKEALKAQPSTVEAVGSEHAFLLLVLGFALSAGPLLSHDETVIDPPSHVGQSAAVSGLVVAVFVSKRGNAFINFGDKFPNQTFTGWIPGRHAASE
jgi:hypothetical protein